MVLDPVTNTEEYGISAMNSENKQVAHAYLLYVKKSDSQWYMIS
jgi:hypothetical protein